MASRTFGRYLLGEQIGRGGMATVFRARDPEFDRDVAVKVLPEDLLQDSEFRSRFQREARSIARLEHPSIVPVYDIGEEQGQPFLVMRFMPGGTLGQRMSRGPLTSAECAAVIDRIASALDEAHRQGMVHRDIKPGNILFDSHGAAYLSDFGIVKLSQAATALTGGGTVGTPSYMSPEQSEGRADVGPATDIYSLGVVLFQMLVGRLPFEADTPVGMALKHIHDPVPQLSSLDPAASAGLQAVIERTLAKRPADRYATAGEMARAFKDAVSSRLAAPRRSSRPSWLVLAAAGLGIAAIALVLVAGGAGLLYSILLQPTPSAQVALPPAESATAQSPGGPTAAAGRPPPSTEASTGVLSTWGPWLVFLQDSALWAVNSDGSGLTQIADGLVPLLPGAAAGIAPSGANVAFIRGSDDRHDLTLQIANLVTRETISVTRLTSVDTEPAPDDVLPFVPPNHILAMTESGSLDWSIDGEHLAFIGAFDGETADLYACAFDGSDIRHLSDGPSQAIAPFWSPDARWVYQAGAEIVRGAGATYDGAWAAAADDSEMVTLITFADDPLRIGTLDALGWLDPETIVLSLQDVMSGEASVRSYSVPAATSTLILQEPVTASAADRPGGTILLSGELSGLTLLRPGRPPRDLSSCRAGGITWQPEAARFVATTDCGVLAVRPDGEVATLTPPQGAWSSPSISVNGEVAWSGGGLWISSLADPVSLPRQVFDGRVESVFWSPDGVYLLAFTTDGLMLAAGAERLPTVVAESVRIQSSLDAGWASWGWEG